MSRNPQRSYRRILVPAGALAAATSLFIAGALARSGSREETPDLQARIARGQYLVTIGACNDCHTPWVMGPEGPAPDTTRMLSGHPHDFPVDQDLPSPSPKWGMTVAVTNTAFAGPWGVSFAANLTPDDTGTGAWTEDIFIKTMRTGRHWGQSRPILPPMPWQSFARMTDEDLASIFAYLRTLPKQHNEVPQPLPPGGAAPADDWP